jgi:hypothetical protein
VRKKETESVETPATRSGARSAVGWFAVWLAVGVALAFSLVDLPAYGLLVFPFAAAAVVLLAVRHRLDHSAWGLLCGIGLLCLYVAYVQRKGPGVVTWHTATASGAETYLDPRPWLAVGLLLVLVSIGVFLWRQRRSA